MDILAAQISGKQITMRKYSVIVSDLGNVLLPFDYKFGVKKLELIESGLGNQFLEYLESNYDLHRKFERGDISTEEFLKIMLTALENKVTEGEFLKIYSQIFTVNDGLVKLYTELAKKYRLVLMSNTNWIHYEYGWGKYDFLKIFDKMVLSYEIHAVKPEPEIFKAVENFTGCPPEEHIFIDDISEYAEAAKSRGWDAVQFITNDQLVNDLKERGII